MSSAYFFTRQFRSKECRMLIEPRGVIVSMQVRAARYRATYVSDKLRVAQLAR